jgi:abhydrolase domain-containing protein 6
MKKLTLAVFFTGLIALAYYFAASAYKNEMYDGAMAMEASLSHLEKKQLQIADGTISYLESASEGKKASILLVHGFGAYKENWLRFARPFNDYHVVILDLPGHGASFKRSELHYDFPHQVAWVHEFAEKVGLQHFHMAGNSMGGGITALYAATYPNEVLSATLIDPAGIHDFRAVLQDYLDKGENPLVVQNTADFNRLMDFALEQKPFVPWPITEVAAERAKVLKPLHDKIFAEFNAPDGFNFKETISKITAPTLIMWGQEDRIINYKNADVFATLIKGSKTDIMPGVGHAPMIEVPRQAAAQMLSLIEAQ